MIVNGVTFLAAVAAILVASALVSLTHDQDARARRRRARARARYAATRRAQYVRPVWSPTLAEHAARARRLAEQRAREAGHATRLAEMEARHADALERMASRPVRVTRPGLTRVPSKRLDVSA